MSSILKDIMVAKFDELNDSTDSVNRTGGWFDVEDGRIKSFELIASSVYEYITNSNGDMHPDKDVNYSGGWVI